MSKEKFYSFCFTDYVLDLNWWDKFYKKNNLTYLVAGKETCPTTGKIHFQGWFHKLNNSTFEAMRKKLEGRHIEIMKGTAEQNNKYCKKDGNVIIELGNIPEPGKRNDLDDIKDMIINKKTEKEIFEKHPGSYIRYYKGIEKAAGLYDEKRNWEMDVRIYWGPPGAGKTRKVYGEFNMDDIYEKMTGKWWDGYQGQKVVLIDDFDPQNTYDIVFDIWLKLLDRYPYRIEYKGGSCQFRSKIIIITSNFDPKTWFSTRENRSALFRRIKTIEHIKA